MIKMLLWKVDPGYRKQQMAMCCLVSAVAIIICGMVLLEKPDLMALAILAGAPAGAVQAIHAAGNVAEHRAKNEAS